MTRLELETALDEGKLWALMTNGNWWRLRRNGRTQTWKRDDYFEVPTKAGLRSCQRLTPRDLTSSNLQISEEKPK